MRGSSLVEDMDPGLRQHFPQHLPHLNVGLWFPGSQEELFGRWYAQNMMRYDAVAMLMCIAFQTVLVFVPGATYGLFFRLSWVQWMIGYCHLIPLAMLASHTGRSFYRSHRDKVLQMHLLVILLYQHLVVENYRYVGPPLFLSCSNVAYSFIWIPFVVLIFQVRFRLLAPTIALFTAVNLFLLRSFCEECRSPTPRTLYRRCIGRGASKVCIMVVAALSVVYFVEWRARRLWVALLRPTRLR